MQLFAQKGGLQNARAPGRRRICSSHYRHPQRNGLCQDGGKSAARPRQRHERLISLVKDGQRIFEPENFRGPTILAAGRLDEEREADIGAMIAAHSQDTKPSYKIKKTTHGEEKSRVFEADKKPRETWDDLRLG
ncbi:MAG: hypothetical protein WAW09_01950 [Smithella sp.]